MCVRFVRNLLSNLDDGLVYFITMAVLFVAIILGALFIISKTGGSSEAEIVEDARGTCVVTDISANGETHQYLMWENGYRGGITHLPNCKYCGKTVNGK